MAWPATETEKKTGECAGETKRHFPIRTKASKGANIVALIASCHWKGPLSTC